jgi:ATP-dependent helicase/nuclease subunit A
MIADALERQQALDVTQSFLVEAGAGSGKTSILSQRHLSALLTVDKPENVLSMTFTRDAANEMRNRISGALTFALNNPRPETDYEQVNYDLALKVIEKDKIMGWGLLNNLQRLSIMTIDSLCASISKQAPLLSGIGGDLSITEDSFTFYTRAATEVLFLLNEEEHPLHLDISNLIIHLNGNQQRAVDLIAEMLGKRDQWLRHVVSNGQAINKDKIISVLSVISDSVNNKALTAIAPLKSDIDELLDIAAKNVTSSYVLSSGSSENDYFKKVAELFLTAKGEFRKKPTKSQGFPAGKEFNTAKEQWQSVADCLSPSMVESIIQVNSLPAIEFKEAQWALLESLFKILLRAVAELKLIFSQENKIDFNEVSSSALQAINPDEQTYVASKLFAMYKHILLDEGQDTNRTQYAIVEALINEWDDSMGNTLFIVGDPKQSVYRFREADVGLFMKAKTHGLGTKKLKVLKLTSNFRTSQNIVEWNNKTYSESFPQLADLSLGAVPYENASPVLENASKEPVVVKALLEKDKIKEAEMVLESINEAQVEFPDGDIAILVRSRPHLVEVAKLLTEQGVSYQAVEIERLNERQCVSDVLSLTKALMHHGDNISWLAILRMPIFALSLNDITLLTATLGEDLVLERIYDQTRLTLLSQDGQHSIMNIKEVVNWAIANQGQYSLRQYVETVWIRMNAPTGYSQNELNDIENFFKILQEYGNDISIDFNALERKIDSSFAVANETAQASKIKLMTMHKSKGLEFSTVILTGLGHAPRSPTGSLVIWHELTTESSGSSGDMLLSPIKGVDDDELYSYLMAIESEKARLEAVRLMYVASTRPKKKLFLIGHVNQKTFGAEASVKSPASTSLLKSIWHSVSHKFLEAARAVEIEEEEEEEVIDTKGSADNLSQQDEKACLDKGFDYKKVVEFTLPVLAQDII